MEWDFRDIGLQRFLDFVDICLKCYMILGISFQIFLGIRDIGDPAPSRASFIRHLYSKYYWLI